MIKRIKSLISVKNLSSSQFADLLGVQRSNISHILSGRNKPSLDFILKITEHFPSVSIEWLLKGKGEMFNLEDKKLESTPSQLNIPVEDSVLEEEISENEIDLLENNKGTEIVENSLENFPNKDNVKEVQPDKLASIAVKEKGIEQIMVLYRNGSFRVYTPEK